MTNATPSPPLRPDTSARADAARRPGGPGAAARTLLLATIIGASGCSLDYTFRATLTDSATDGGSDGSTTDVGTRGDTLSAGTGTDSASGGATTSGSASASGGATGTSGSASATGTAGGSSTTTAGTTSASTTSGTTGTTDTGEEPEETEGEDALRRDAL